MFFSECFSREKLIDVLIFIEISQRQNLLVQLKNVHFFNFFKKIHYIMNKLRLSCVINKFFELTLYNREFRFG
jgi:hypothetical protein